MPVCQQLRHRHNSKSGSDRGLSRGPVELRDPIAKALKNGPRLDRRGFVIEEFVRGCVVVDAGEEKIGRTTALEESEVNRLLSS